jgi:hypothetical protein
MNTKVESLDCPNCGAPLDVKPGQEITVCQYCSSSIRIHLQEDDSENAVPKTEVSAETMKLVKELVLSGKKDEAVDLYMREADISNEDAVKAVSQIYDTMSASIMLNRPLSLIGFLLTLLFLSFFTVSGYFAIVSDIDSSAIKIISWISLFFWGISLLSISRTIITTFKFLPGKWADAKILKFVKVGEKKNVAIFRLLLEVMPENKEHFQAQTNLPVRLKSVNLIAEGNIIKVKYLPDKKGPVIASIEELKKEQNK